MSTEPISSVIVNVRCPVCGSEDYEFEFDADDISRGVEISCECDDCDQRIAVHATVDVNAREVSR